MSADGFDLHPEGCACTVHAPPAAPVCTHVFPDGTRCTLTDHTAPGLAEVHGPPVAPVTEGDAPRAAPDAGGGERDE